MRFRVRRGLLRRGGACAPRGGVARGGRAGAGRGAVERAGARGPRGALDAGHRVAHRRRGSYERDAVLLLLLDARHRARRRSVRDAQCTPR